MRNRIISFAIAALLLFPAFGTVAYATELEDEVGIDVAAEGEAEPGGPGADTGADTGADGYPDTGTYEPGTDGYTDIDMDIGMGDMAALLSLFMLPFLGMVDYDAPGDITLPARPPGTATVIDYNTDPDGRLFYTIMTPDEHVFYLIVDKNSNTDNVYFLNAVTIADLLPLAQSPVPAPPPGGGMGAAPPDATGGTGQPGETPPPPEVEPEQGGNGMGLYIFIIAVVAIGGGAGWYFKIYRPKQQGASGGDEYDPSLNDMDNDYSDDWGEDTDGDTGEYAGEYTDGDSGDYPDDTDDAPPWDEGGESGDRE